MPHTSNLRIKSFDSLSTQTRSSKVLQIQYRSLVSHNDSITTRVMTTHETDLTSVGVSGPPRSQDMSDGSGCGQVLVKARFPFQQTNEDELSFSKGDIITVSRQEDGGWWEGSLNGKTGWFPSNYVRELKGSGRCTSYWCRGCEFHSSVFFYHLYCL